MAFDVKTWIGQKTTGVGFAAALGVVSAVATGQMTWMQAAPVLIGALLSILWPENKDVQAAGTTLAEDLIKFIPVISAAVEHGKASVPAPAAAPTTNTQGTAQ